MTEETEPIDSFEAADEYQSYLESKMVAAVDTGFFIDESNLNTMLFPWQKKIVKWAIQRGKAALFPDTGLGKTFLSLEWSHQIHLKTGGNILILAPLAVASQTAREAIKFGIGTKVKVCRTQSDCEPGISVTNYEMLDEFDPSFFIGVVLDESSVLKNYTGKTKQAIIASFANTQYKLACTATPAPNDHMEIGNHAQFLDVMNSSEMLSRWFLNDTMKAGGYRLKSHALKDFYRWMATWAVSLGNPSDIGFPDEGYTLPELDILQHVVAVDTTIATDGKLFRSPDLSATGLHSEMRLTAPARAQKVADIIASAPDERWCIWCNTEYEAEELRKRIPDLVEVKGSDSRKYKEQTILDFADGKINRFLSKPSICGAGLNLQVCHNLIFVGLSYSYEEFYQAIRRFWRFGQTHKVNCHVVCADTEGPVLATIERKKRDHESMKAEMILAMRDQTMEELGVKLKLKMDFERDVQTGKGWEMRLGDSVELMRELPDNHIGMSIFSPPFSNLYIYSDSVRDMGNTADDAEFFKAFSFIAKELYRTTIPGRVAAIHCKDLPTYRGRDGASGLKDFPGDIIRLFEYHGWDFHSRVTIWKCPVTERERTNNNGLLHKTVTRDSSQVRMGMADYLIVMRKTPLGDSNLSDVPVARPNGFEHYIGELDPRNNSFHPSPYARTEFDGKRDSIAIWRRYAEPVWWDIDQTDVLNIKQSRTENEERHICLANDSLVLTRNGYVPIQTVEIGDLVLTHKGNWKPVIAKKCNGVSPVVKVRAHGVANLKVTPTHELWTRKVTGDKQRLKALKTDPQWVPALDTLGSYVNLKLPPVEYSPLTQKEWWIVGRWLGDGHRGFKREKHGVVPYVISCSYDEVYELSAALGSHAGHVSYRTAAQIALRGLGDNIRGVLDRCGHGASGKRLPAEALCLSQEKADSLLSGYLSADGHYVPKYERCTASSVSRSLLLGMSLVAQRARGVVASVYAGRAPGSTIIDGRHVNTEQEWIFSFRNTKGPHHQSGWIGDDGAWKKVRHVEYAGDDLVWDLQVADDESFTAEGCIVHNCPLQMGVIKRAIELWSLPDDLVFSPFGGIGSEGVGALEMGRRALLMELKRSYFTIACRNMDAHESQQETLF